MAFHQNKNKILNSSHNLRYSLWCGPSRSFQPICYYSSLPYSTSTHYYCYSISMFLECYKLGFTSGPWHLLLHTTRMLLHRALASTTHWISEGSPENRTKKLLTYFFRLVFLFILKVFIHICIIYNKEVYLYLLLHIIRKYTCIYIY